MEATHKTVSTNKLKQGSCHIGCRKRRVGNKQFLTRFFHALCYAIGAEKSLIQAALRAHFPRGKGFIPFPSKMPFYCVTCLPQKQQFCKVVGLNGFCISQQLPLLDYPILDFPTSGYPTSENPTQLNKDILTKEKPNTDLIKYLFPSYPFPNPSPLEQGIAAEPPERKRMEQKRQYKNIVCYVTQ